MYSHLSAFFLVNISSLTSVCFCRAVLFYCIVFHMNISQFIALPVGGHLGCVITNNTDTNVLVHVFYCCIPKNELLDIFDVLITGNFVYMLLIVFYF